MNLKGRMGTLYRTKDLCLSVFLAVSFRRGGVEAGEGLHPYPMEGSHGERNTGVCRWLVRFGWGRGEGGGGRVAGVETSSCVPCLI